MYVGEGSSIPNINGMRTDVVEALKHIKLPVLRWPGGCFADEYHWKDGIGPKAGRKRMVNTHWGGVIEDNSFGTHEFLEFCRQVGCEPYINGNLGKRPFGRAAQGIVARLIDACDEAGVPVLNISMYDAAELRRAQREPERYKDLIVRVWGFNARFVELDEELQNHIIGRIC